MNKTERDWLFKSCLLFVNPSDESVYLNFLNFNMQARGRLAVDSDNRQPRNFLNFNVRTLSGFQVGCEITSYQILSNGLPLIEYGQSNILFWNLFVNDGQSLWLTELHK